MLNEIQVTTVIQPLSKSDAETLTKQIRAHLVGIEKHEREARVLLLQMHRSDGWRAMGYVSFAEWAQQEFGLSYQYVYRILNASEVQANIETFSPMGENLMLKERHARALKDLAPEQQAEAFTIALKIAQSEGKELELRHVEIAVKTVKHEQVALKYAPIGLMVRMNEITAECGAEMVKQIDLLKPVIRGGMVALIAKSGLSDPALIAPLAEMISRDAEKPSKILAEVRQYGTIGGTPLRSATFTDYEVACENATREYRDEAIQAKIDNGQSVPVSVILDKLNVEASARAIVRALGKDASYAVMVKLAEMLQD